jgi:diguanylate cyclase (GGDEF)-like protein
MGRDTLQLDASEGAHQKHGESQARAFVVVLAGDRMGEMFPLNDGRTSIGRGLHADVRINDEGISRVHAQIHCEDGKYFLSDAGSTNGTYANGDRVDRHELGEGDKIQIGASSVLKFTYHDEIDEDFQRSLYESALRDRLTGIFNRGYFNNRLESDVAFALRHGKPLSLVIFDLDEFKKINDTHGHPVGDAVLRKLAERVQGTTRSEDILARYGGEEFVLICRDVDALRASRAAYRIMELVSGAPFEADGKSLNVTVSLGVADLAMLHQPSSSALVKAADTALYVAKRQGRNRVEIFDPDNEPTRLV